MDWLPDRRSTPSTAVASFPGVSVFGLLFADIDQTGLDRIALIDTPGGTHTTYRESIERANATPRRLDTLARSLRFVGGDRCSASQ